MMIEDRIMDGGEGITVRLHQRNPKFPVDSVYCRFSEVSGWQYLGTIGQRAGDPFHAFWSFGYLVEDDQVEVERILQGMIKWKLKTYKPKPLPKSLR